jgi:hypothetical protein
MATLKANSFKVRLTYGLCPFLPTLRGRNRKGEEEEEKERKINKTANSFRKFKPTDFWSKNSRIEEIGLRGLGICIKGYI